MTLLHPPESLFFVQIAHLISTYVSTFLQENKIKKVKKVQCVRGAIWENIEYLGIFFTSNCAYWIVFQGKKSLKSLETRYIMEHKS